MKKFLTGVLLAVLYFVPNVWAGAGLADLERALKAMAQERSLCPVRRADDATFLRRAYLTLAGKLPHPGEVRDFLRDNSPRKRAEIIDMLLDSPDFARLMGMRYCQIYRVKSEFPINMWPNAVQLFHSYLVDAAGRDRPYNAMVREMLTSSGSNFRVPQVNFLRGHADRTPKGIATGVALVLMGIRLDKLDAETAEGMAAFFSALEHKATDEWKEEIVFTSPAEKRITARTPDGKKFTIYSPGTDPRQVFADYLCAPDNPYFARAFANRAWHWVFGKGLIDPADDMTGVPSRRLFEKVYPVRTNPALDVLAEAFRDRGYRVKELFRIICNSSTFNAAWRTLPGEQTAAEECFAVYPVHRMEPELVVDALARVTGGSDRYRSVIPEPFTFLPPGTPAVGIADGSISSGVLDSFGRSPRDSGQLAEVKTHVTVSQRQWLMNSNVLYGRLFNRNRNMLNQFRRDPQARVSELYLSVLSRFPTATERVMIANRLKRAEKEQRGRVWVDVLWALINSGEFLYHH